MLNRALPVALSLISLIQNDLQYLIRTGIQATGFINSRKWILNYNKMQGSTKNLNKYEHF
jgi:hypothetical protein